MEEALLIPCSSPDDARETALIRVVMADTASLHVMYAQQSNAPGGNESWKRR